MDRPGKGVGIAGGVEEGLPLRGHLLEELLGRWVRSPAPPGATELLGKVVVRHAAQQIDPRAGIGRFIDVDGGEARRHGDRHLDVQGDFDGAAAGRADAAVHGHHRQRHMRQAGLGFVGRDVIGVEAVKLQQPDALAGAGQGRARHVSGAEVASLVAASWPGPGLRRGIGGEARRASATTLGCGRA